MTSPKESLSLCIPVYNSAECLAELVKQVAQSLSEYDYEIIFVDDCSPDTSWEVIHSLSQQYKYIKGVRLLKNSGQDNAIMAGLGLAKGDYTVIMDDDLQHAPSDIPRLLDYLNKNSLDFCYANFQYKKQALWKNWGSWLNGKIFEICMEKKRDIYISPFKIIKKKLVDEVVKFQSPFPYIDAILMKITHRYGQLEVQHHERYKGKGNYSLSKSIDVFFKMIFSYSILPLRLAFFSGLIIAFLGFITAGVYIYDYFMHPGRVVEGWTTLIVVTLVIGGINLIFIGAVGEYLGRLYLKTNYLPPYIISETTK